MGHARTFWTAWQRARDAGGALVMRMEDLDPDRSRAIYADAALEDLRWLGIRWHEGPDRGGPFAPYVQSKRREVYLDAWRKLLDGGFLFPCKCSRKDLHAAAGAPHEAASRRKPARWANPKLWRMSRSIPGTCRHRGGHAPQLPGPTGLDEESPEGANWRFRVPDGEVVEFNDLNLGPQRYVAGEDFGDFVVWRRDGAQLPARLRGRRRGHGHHRGSARRRPAEVDGAADSALSRLGPPPNGFIAAWWWTTTAGGWPNGTMRSASARCAGAD